MMIEMKKLRAYLWFFLLLTFLLPSFVLADGDDPFYDVAGLNSYRETLGNTDFEHIDPYTGGLTLNFVDMSIPGNNGLDLVLQRFYNSKDSCRNWVETCVGTSCAINCNYTVNSWVGVGWSLHMGKLMLPIISGNPVIEMPDGSQHEAFHDINGPSYSYITKDYWKLVEYPSNTWTLIFTDGRKMYFGNTDSTSDNSQYYEYYATKIEDTTGNNIAIEYYNAGWNYPPYAPYAIKKITDSVGRVTNFTLTSTPIPQYGKYRLAYITRPDGERISFDYLTIPSSSSLAKLNSATPPEGSPWLFQYNTGISEMTELTTPYGGKIDYAYQTTKSTYAAGICYHNYRTIKTKTTSGVDAPGAWNFLYEQDTAKDYTVLTDSCGRTTKYRYYGYNSGLINGQMWQLGLPISKEVVGEEKITYDMGKFSLYFQRQLLWNSMRLKHE